jgi:hypothetical protein
VALRDHAVTATLREMRLAGMSEKASRLTLLSRRNSDGAVSAASATDVPAARLLEETAGRASAAIAQLGVMPRGLDAWRLTYVGLARVVQNPAALPQGVLPPAAVQAAAALDSRMDEMGRLLRELATASAEREVALQRATVELQQVRARVETATGAAEAAGALQTENATLRRQHAADVQRMAGLERHVARLTLDAERAMQQLGVAAAERTALEAARRSLQAVASALEQRVAMLEGRGDGGGSGSMGSSGVAAVESSPAHHESPSPKASPRGSDPPRSPSPILLDERLLPARLAARAQSSSSVPAADADPSALDSPVPGSSVHGPIAPAIVAATGASGAPTRFMSPLTLPGASSAPPLQAPGRPTSATRRAVAPSPVPSVATPDLKHGPVAQLAARTTPLSRSPASLSARALWLPPSESELSNAAAAVAARTEAIVRLENAAAAVRAAYERHSRSVAESMSKGPTQRS